MSSRNFVPKGWCSQNSLGNNLASRNTSLYCKCFEILTGNCVKAPQITLQLQFSEALMVKRFIIHNRHSKSYTAFFMICMLFSPNEVPRRRFRRQFMIRSFCYKLWGYFIYIQFISAVLLYTYCTIIGCCCGIITCHTAVCCCSCGCSIRYISGTISECCFSSLWIL
jgi:hypothetical protein